MAGTKVLVDQYQPVPSGASPNARLDGHRDDHHPIQWALVGYRHMSGYGGMHDCFTCASRATVTLTVAIYHCGSSVQCSGNQMIRPTELDSE